MTILVTVNSYSRNWEGLLEKASFSFQMDIARENHSLTNKCWVKAVIVVHTQSRERIVVLAQGRSHCVAFPMGAPRQNVKYRLSRVAASFQIRKTSLNVAVLYDSHEPLLPHFGKWVWPRFGGNGPNHDRLVLKSIQELQNLYIYSS